MVPFIPGVSTVKAEVLGKVADTTQLMLRLEYEAQDDQGKWITIRKEFQREERYLEGLLRDYR
jgi:hypothetical protein